MFEKIPGPTDNFGQLPAAVECLTATLTTVDEPQREPALWALSAGLVCIGCVSFLLACLPSHPSLMPHLGVCVVHLLLLDLISGRKPSRSLLVRLWPFAAA
jgi:hypothetical protein